MHAHSNTLARKRNCFARIILRRKAADFCSRSLSLTHSLPFSLSQFNIADRSKSDAHKSVITNHVRCRRGQWHRQRRPGGSWERAVLSLSPLSPRPPFLRPPVDERHPPFSGGGASRSGNDSWAHNVLRGSGNSRDRNARCRSLACSR